MNESIKESIKLMLLVNADPSLNITGETAFGEIGENGHYQTIDELGEFNRERLFNLCELLGYEDLINEVYPNGKD